MATKIDIISGFLGAGKTTLIQKLLTDGLSGEKVVLIENEFGEIGIDGGILKQTGIEIREINSGCICCTLVGDFGTALNEVLNQYHPSRILIEPSGVGKLSDVLAACQKIAANNNAVINICMTVVDVLKYQMYHKNFSEFFGNQIEHAKTIILSRTQKADDDKLNAAVKDIQIANKNAPIITTPWDLLSGKNILDVAENNIGTTLMLNPSEKQEHGHMCHCHDADKAFDVWSRETPKHFDSQKIETMLHALSQPLYGTVLRAKGIVPLSTGKWMQFDFVPEEVDFKEIPPNYTGCLCVIGKNLNMAKLAELFEV